MKVFVLALSLVLSALLSCGDQAGPGKRTTITIKGSDTMVILGQRWAEEYMNKRKDIIIQVTGGGSGTGIAALINKSTNICQSSRPMKDKEKAQVKEKHGRDVVEVPVALDGLAIYLHESSPLTEISVPKLKEIYTGKITNWKDLGHVDATVIAYSRENNSGTYMYFKEHVLNNADFAPGIQTLPGTAAVVNAVSKDRNSIGYGGIAYGKGIKAIKVKKDEGSTAIEPTLENVVNGSYPISRYLYFYLAGEPQGEIKAFIDWILSADGQKICESVGYYPLPKK